MIPACEKPMDTTQNVCELWSHPLCGKYWLIWLTQLAVQCPLRSSRELDYATSTALWAVADDLWALFDGDQKMMLLMMKALANSATVVDATTAALLKGPVENLEESNVAQP